MAEKKTKTSKPTRSLSRTKFDKELKNLQTELCHLQTWIRMSHQNSFGLFRQVDRSQLGKVFRLRPVRVPFRCAMPDKSMYLKIAASQPAGIDLTDRLYDNDRIEL